MPGNRLELDIVANDRTQPETQKASANFKSVEAEAVRAARSMSKSFDSASVDLVRSIQKGTASAESALQGLERRAALVGKTGIEKLLIQRSQAITLWRRRGRHSTRGQILRQADLSAAEV